MKKIICLYVLGILNVCSIVVAMQSETCEIAATPQEQNVAEKLKKGQGFIAQHKYEDVNKIMKELKHLADLDYQKMSGNWHPSIYGQAHEKLKRELLKVIQSTQESVEQSKLKYENASGILENASDILNKFKTLSESIHEDYKYKFDREITKLEQLLSLKQAEDYANNHKYKAAYEILDRLMKSETKGSVNLFMEITAQKAEWEKSQKPVGPVEQKWFFIKQISGAEPVKKNDWKIQDQKLLLNLDATDAITAESFEDLIQQAQKDNLPFILVMVQSGDSSKFFPHFFGVNILISLMQNSNDNKLINPMNREIVTNMGIYVMGDDGILHLLKDKVDANYLKQFVDYTGHTDDLHIGRRIHNYKLRPELEDPRNPAAAQVFIADCYKTQANYTFWGWKIKSEPKARQLERLWLGWALSKFIPEDLTQKEQVIQRLNAIPDRPELLTGTKKIEQN